MYTWEIVHQQTASIGIGSHNSDSLKPRIKSIFIGSNSGGGLTASTSNNTCVGKDTMHSSSGSNNVYIGSECEKSSSASNCICIGMNAGKNNTTSNKLIINNGMTNTIIHGSAENAADASSLNLSAKDLYIGGDTSQTLSPILHMVHASNHCGPNEVLAIQQVSQRIAGGSDVSYFQTIYKSDNKHGVGLNLGQVEFKPFETNTNVWRMKIGKLTTNDAGVSINGPLYVENMPAESSTESNNSANGTLYNDSSGYIKIKGVTGNIILSSTLDIGLETNTTSNTQNYRSSMGNGGGTVYQLNRANFYGKTSNGTVNLYAYEDTYIGDNNNTQPYAAKTFTLEQAGIEKNILKLGKVNSTDTNEARVFGIFQTTTLRFDDGTSMSTAASGGGGSSFVPIPTAYCGSRNRTSLLSFLSGSYTSNTQLFDGNLANQTVNGWGTNDMAFKFTDGTARCINEFTIWMNGGSTGAETDSLRSTVLKIYGSNDATTSSNGIWYNLNTTATGSCWLDEAIARKSYIWSQYAQMYPQGWTFRATSNTGRIGSRQQLAGGVSWGCSGGAQRSYGDHLHPIRLRFHGKPLF